MTRTALAIVSLMVAGLSAWGWISTRAELDRLRTDRTASRTLVRAIDGDTVELDGMQRVRLQGVSAPESWEKIDGEWRKIDPPDPAATAAWDCTRSWEGRRVILRPVARDYYGRTVGDITDARTGADLAAAVRAALPGPRAPVAAAPEK